MDAVIAAASPQRKLLVLFAYHTGARPAEIMTREKADIDLEEGLLRIGHRGEFRVKRDKPRTIGLTPRLAAALREAWDALPDEGPIFAGQDLRGSLRGACKRAGVPAIPPYGTRHSFASRWAAEGRSREALVKLMGHADGRMIDAVYSHFGASQMRDQMAQVGWGEVADVIPLRRGQAPA